MQICIKIIGCYSSGGGVGGGSIKQKYKNEIVAYYQSKKWNTN